MKREDAVKLAGDALSKLSKALEQGKSDELVNFLRMRSRFLITHLEIAC